MDVLEEGEEEVVERVSWRLEGFPRLLMLNLLPLQCTANGAIGGHGRRALPPAVEALKLQPGVQFNRHFGDFPKPVPNPVWSFETCKL